MLKVEIDENGVNTFEVSGNMMNMIADLDFLITKIYRCIRSDSEMAGDLFKKVFTKTIVNDDSPVWMFYDSSGERAN